MHHDFPQQGWNPGKFSVLKIDRDPGKLGKQSETMKPSLEVPWSKFPQTHNHILHRMKNKLKTLIHVYTGNENPYPHIDLHVLHSNWLHYFMLVTQNANTQKIAPCMTFY